MKLISLCEATNIFLSDVSLTGFPDQSDKETIKQTAAEQLKKLSQMWHSSPFVLILINSHEATVVYS